MLEGDKQREEQLEKYAKEKERHARKKKHTENQGEQRQAGMTSDPQAARDQGYVERIDGKTQKH